MPVKKTFKRNSLSLMFKERKCFKLVCGAGNEDAEEVEKLVFLYSSAGANYFDISAKEEVIYAAKRGILRSGFSRKERFLNVSVGIKGDPHVSKAEISPGCTACGKCALVCPQRAISKGKIYKVNNLRCIGCGACIKVCVFSCIKIISRPEPLDKVLPPLIEIGLDSIELHASTGSDDEVVSQWMEIEKRFKGFLSLCLDRSQLGDIQLLTRIKKVISNRPEFSTIIQADGAPMSGCDDSYSTTLQALATAQIVQRASLPVYLIVSGGTNSKTAKMARLFKIKTHGVALGSYARKIVSNYIKEEKFFDGSKYFKLALEAAKMLVNITMRYI